MWRTQFSAEFRRRPVSGGRTHRGKKDRNLVFTKARFQTPRNRIWGEFYQVSKESVLGKGWWFIDVRRTLVRATSGATERFIQNRFWGEKIIKPGDVQESTKQPLIVRVWNTVQRLHSHPLMRNLRELVEEWLCRIEMSEMHFTSHFRVSKMCWELVILACHVWREKRTWDARIEDSNDSADNSWGVVKSICKTKWRIILDSEQDSIVRMKNELICTTTECQAHCERRLDDKKGRSRGCRRETVSTTDNAELLWGELKGCFRERTFRSRELDKVEGEPLTETPIGQALRGTHNERERHRDTPTDRALRGTLNEREIDMRVGTSGMERGETRARWESNLKVSSIQQVQYEGITAKVRGHWSW